MASIEAAAMFACFMLLGSGTNWVLPTALVQEVPRLQKTHPEGISLTHPVTHSFAHLLTHSLYHSFTHSLA